MLKKGPKEPFFSEVLRALVFFRRKISKDLQPYVHRQNHQMCICTYAAGYCSVKPSPARKGNLTLSASPPRTQARL